MNKKTIYLDPKLNEFRGILNAILEIKVDEIIIKKYLSQVLNLPIWYYTFNFWQLLKNLLVFLL